MEKSEKKETWIQERRAQLAGSLSILFPVHTQLIVGDMLNPQ